MSSNKDRFSETEAELSAIRARGEASRRQKQDEQVRQTLVAQLATRPDATVTTIPLAFVDRSRNLRAAVRGDEASFVALRESIRECGLLQLPVVTVLDERIVCVAGHRRMAAVEELGHTEVKCVVRKLEPLLAMPTASLVENTNRLQLSALELARAIGSILGLGYSIVRLAEILGRDRKYVERLNKIDKWPAEAKDIISARQESFTLKFLMHLAARRMSDAQIVTALREHLEGVTRDRSAWETIRVRRNQVRLRDFLSEHGLGEREEQVIRQFLEYLGLPGWGVRRAGASAAQRRRRRGSEKPAPSRSPME